MRYPEFFVLEPKLTIPCLQLSSDLGQQHPIYVPNFNDTALLEECVKYSDVVINLTGLVYFRLNKFEPEKIITVNL